ncbi:MAG TPA: rod shape-determining protein MreC [Candidatus Methylacidiphilales bacterium]|nr:rod shape-determining protein MreC [Candidatus Methylacidiphilales bacterium]
MKKSSTSLLVVIGLLSAFTIVCFFLPDQFTHTLRKGALEIFGPILRAGERPVKFVTNVDTKLQTLDQAQAELVKLRQQVAELTMRNQILEDKTAENQRLREMLGFRDASPYRLRACRVLSRDPDSWWTSVQVNVGWRDDPDLAKDQPVVSPRGVVGKTGTVSRDVTEVILMVDRNCSITATVDGTQDQGIVKGQGNFEQGGSRILMEYLPKNSTVAKGQFIVTSSLSPNFPAGLKIGQVTEVPPLNNGYPTFGMYREAVIEPTANLNQLDELFIVLGPKQPAQPANAPDTNAPPANPASPTNGDNASADAAH